MSMTETRHWGEIDGVSIDFPMEVTSFNSATLTWTVPVEPARELIPGDGFEVADMGDGNTMLILALCDYRENPWGDYDEVNFGILVHPKGRPEEVGAFQWRMPVNQQMTATAGSRVLGLPKTVEELGFTYTDDRVEVDLSMGGEPTLTIGFPRTPPRTARSPTPTSTVRPRWFPSPSSSRREWSIRQRWRSNSAPRTQQRNSAAWASPAPRRWRCGVKDCAARSSGRRRSELRPGSGTRRPRPRCPGGAARALHLR
jgi:hypothetical protein